MKPIENPGTTFGGIHPPTSPLAKGGIEVGSEIRKNLCAVYSALIIFVFLSLPALVSAASMGDYCVVPPYAKASAPPNLLLMLDNSASQFDLQYVDQGRTSGLCSITRTTSCAQDSDCGTETCVKSYYCYDETFSTANTYTGYFETQTSAGATIYYQYNLADNYFYKVNSLPSSCPSGTSKSVANTLFMCVNAATTPHSVTLFAASGKYLNWLTTSKFDVQKGVLTGGKFVSKMCTTTVSTSPKDVACTENGDCVTGETCVNDPRSITFMQAESRGCVGRKYLKEALTSDFENFAMGSADPNQPAGCTLGTDPCSLGITFGIRGPVDTYNPTAPSRGGQTYINVYEGNYNQSLCQSAIDAFVAGHDPASIKQAVDDCLTYTTIATAICLDAAHDPDLPPSGTLPRYGTTCTRASDCIISDGLCEGPGGGKTCTSGYGDPAKAGMSCTNDNNCNTDVGPCATPTSPTRAKQQVVFSQAIQACWALSNGTPISIDEVNTIKNQCSDLYDQNFVCNGGANYGKSCTGASDCPGGACDNGPDAIFPGNPSLVCNSTYAGFCASTTNNWTTTNWIASGYASDVACIVAKHTAFCTNLQIPPVIDPTDAPSDTENYYNMPAIISDIGVEAQLNEPIGTMTVQIYKATEPTGVLQVFSNLVRFGAMTFNNFGAPSECPASVPCPKICSNNITKTCTLDIDCPGGSCIASTAGTNNSDGGKIVHYIGDPGVCSSTGSTTCTGDSGCPSGERCISVGNHSYGLVSAVDKIRGATWTPFAEAFYSAIGYLAKDLSESYTTPPTVGTSRNLRIQSGDYVLTKNPSQYPCQENDILIITDGMSTADASTLSEGVATTYGSAFPSPYTNVSGYDSANSCPNYAGSRSLYGLAWVAQNRNIRSFETGALSTGTPATSSEKINTYVVFSGSTTSPNTGLCNPYTLMDKTAAAGGTGSAFAASNPTELQLKIKEALNNVIKRAASGTAASVLASGEGSGANLVQAVFYPKRRYQDSSGVLTDVAWTGRVSNLWYYSDPFFETSTIRDDYSGGGTRDNIMDISSSGDRIVKTYFVPSQGTTFTRPNGTSATSPITYTKPGGTTETCSECTVADLNTGSPTMLLEDLTTLWEAGNLLWSRAASDRKILAPLVSGAADVPTATGTGLMYFTRSNVTKLLTNMDTTDGRMIDYVRGYDKFCTGTTTGCETTTDCSGVLTCDASSFRPRTFVDGGVSHVWKLGDVLDSTPKIASMVALNNYDVVYNDNTYKDYTKSSDYLSRGMVFAGGNDGMLHAFYLGKLEQSGSWKTSEDKKAYLGDPSSIGRGKEIWAFVPKNALPYLKYMADPSYCHIFTVDMTPYIFDASITSSPTSTTPSAARTSSSWRTIVIGGMRYGGACRDTGVACNGGTTNCVNNPISGVGYSSYFALDITDTLAHPDAPASYPPKLLWEFSHSDLGFASSGPSVVRINYKDGAGIIDKSKNGYWFVVFGSGPTGPIDTTNQQFLGRSDQDLRLFVLDLATGTLQTGYPLNTTVTNAFAGNMLSSTIDPDLNYGDNAVYVPYVKYDSSASSWTQGGIGRLQTLEDPDTSHWEYTTVIDNIGPVPSAVGRLQNTKLNILWLFAGTGRYYFKTTSSSDDSTGQRRLLGFKEPCFADVKGNTSCTASALGLSDLLDVTCSSGLSGCVPSEADANDSSFNGWYIDLEGSGVGPCGSQSCYAERVITDPSAMTSGNVFFTTYKPYSSVCDLGGKSFVWALRYNTGGSPGTASLKGKILLQLSTGSIEQVDLASAFPDTQAGKYGRRSTDMEGQPPTSKPPLLSTQNPIKRVLHMRER